MAKKNMTLEEKLEEAIVKDEPYEVPRNWVWSRLGNITTVKSSKRILAKEYIDEGIPFYRSKEIVELSLDFDVSTEIFISNQRYQEICDKFGVPQPGDLLITSVGTIGKTWIVDNRKFYYKDGNVTQIQKNKVLNTKYIQRYIESSYFEKWVKDVVSGSAYNALTIDKLKNLHIPIPPLKEQQRIVDRIESLFEKLDKAKELIEESREGFEKRKSAVLEKAFRGNLTQKWRKENQNESIDGLINEIKSKNIKYQVYGFDESFKNITLPFSWRFVNLGSICCKITDGSHNPPTKQERGYPMISAKNISKGIFDLSKIDRYVLEEDFVKEDKRTQIQKGDILLAIIGASIGNIAIYDVANKVVAQRSLCVIDTYTNNNFVYYMLKCDLIQREMLAKATGTAQPGLYLNSIRELIIPLPPLNEQKEIVKILDKLLEEESKIEELTQLEDQIELIKRSILAKAFRGELGTNSQDDESVLELLKEILSKDI